MRRRVPRARSTQTVLRRAFFVLLAALSLASTGPGGITATQPVDATMDLSVPDETPAPEGPDGQDTSGEEDGAQSSSPEEFPPVDDPSEEGGEPGLHSEGEVDIDFLDDEVYLLAEDEAVVYNESGFRSALQSPSITTIYLGDDIKMTSGIEVSSGKAKLIIDGTDPDDPETIHTLTEYRASGEGDTISVRTNAGPKEVELRNLNIVGENHFGTVCIYTAARDVTTTYRNVTYSGPQLTWNRHGTAHYIDCDISIGSGYSAPGEVAEAAAVLLEGEITIRQTRANDNELFYIELYTGDVEILPGARVTCEIFGNSGLLFSAQTGNKIIVGENAVFRYTAPKRFWDGGYAPDTLWVKSGAEMYIDITDNSLIPIDVVRLRKELIVEEDATFHIKLPGTFSSTEWAPLAFATGGGMDLQSPRSVVIYYPNRRTLRYRDTPGSFSATAQQIGYWTTAADLSVAGSLSDPPLYRWRKADDSDVTISGTISQNDSGNFTAISSDYTEGDGTAPPPTADTYNMISSRVLAWGRLDVSAQFAFMEPGEYRVFGTTSPNAFIRVQYYNGQGELILFGEGYADEDGLFSILRRGEEIPENTELTVIANVNFLTSHTTCGSYIPSLHFDEVPDTITFQTTSLQTRPWIVHREPDSWSLRIFDSRGEGATWRLSVMAESELTPVRQNYNESTMDYALIFIDEEGDVHTLFEGSVIPIRETVSTSLPEMTTLTWEGESGLLVRAPPGAYANTPYHGQLQWILENVP